MILKEIGPKGLVCPNPGAIYMYFIIILKHLLLRNLANQSEILNEASYLKEGGTNVYINPGHMTKMATMPIYGNKKQL